MQLLRDNMDSLMSVLDAFVHDPLVEWEDEKRKLVSTTASGCTRGLTGGVGARAVATEQREGVGRPAHAGEERAEPDREEAAGGVLDEQGAAREGDLDGQPRADAHTGGDGLHEPGASVSVLAGQHGLILVCRARCTPGGCRGIDSCKPASWTGATTFPGHAGYGVGRVC